jgi:hypothetical protein
MEGIHPPREAWRRGFGEKKRSYGGWEGELYVFVEEGEGAVIVVLMRKEERGRRRWWMRVMAAGTGRQRRGRKECGRKYCGRSVPAGIPWKEHWRKERQGKNAGGWSMAVWIWRSDAEVSAWRHI